MFYPTKKLGEVCDLYQPKTISKAEMVSSGQYKVYGANGVIGRYDKYNHEQSEILVTCRGATCGTVNVSEPKSWINGNAMVVRPKSEKEILKEYLYYLLKGGIDMSTAISGSAQPQITRTTLSPIEIPLPPIDIQKKIVAKLERVLAKISEAKKLRTEARENADNLLSAELHKIFGEGKKRNWKEKRLKDLCANYKQNIVDGPFGSDMKRSDYLVSGIPVLKIQNVKEYRLEIKKIDFVSDSKAKELIRHSYRAGDIVMTKLGEPLGISAIVSGIDDGIIVADLIRVRAQKIDTKYLCYFLNSEKTKEFINSQQKGTTRKRIKLSVIRELPILVPPLTVQKKIVARLDSLSEKIASLRQAQAKTQNDFTALEQSVLSQAFSNK